MSHSHGGGSPADVSGFPVYPVIGIFVIFILSLAGSAIPPLVAKYKPEFDMQKNFIFRFFAGFAAGTIIGVGFIHSFIEGAHDLEALGDYAFAGLFALLGGLSTFTAEEVVKAIVPDAGHDHSGGGGKQEHFHHHHGPEHEHHHAGVSKTKRDFYIEMWVLLCGLTFHSFFVGLALGLSYNALGLFLAILFHQFFEGVALGFRIARVKLARSFIIWFIDMLFAISAPAGIIIGIIIIESTGEESEQVTIVKGTFNAFSAGILLYVGFVHMLAEEMERTETSKPLLRVAIYTGVILGAAIMAVIGIWA